MRGYLGNSTRNRPKQSAKTKNSGGQSHRRRRRRNDYPDDDGNLEIIPPEQLEQTKKIMSLTELKTHPPTKLVELATSLGLDNLARSRKQDIIFLFSKSMPKKVRIFMAMEF